MDDVSYAAAGAETLSAIAINTAQIMALISYSHLLHVCGTVLEQPFFDHNAVFPMPHSAHVYGEFLARWLNEFPVSDRHGLVKVPVITPIPEVHSPDPIFTG